MNKTTNEVFTIPVQDEDDREWSFEDALSYIGLGKIHYYLTFIGGLIISASMTETMAMSFIMKSAECDLSLKAAEKGVMSSIVYVGIVSMAFIWGYLSDTRGRRKVLKWTLLCTSTLSILSSFAPNYSSFVLLRFFVGAFLSGSIGSTYPYLGEFTPEKNRQMIMSLASAFFGLSQLYVPTVAWLVFSFLDFRLSIFGLLHYRPWRFLIVLFALPGLIASIALFFLPESPKYHMAQNNIPEALKGLEWIYKKNIEKGKLPIKKLKCETNESDVSKRKTFLQSIVTQALPILKPPYVKHLVVSFLIVFAIFFTSASLGLWYMEIENRVSKSTIKGTLCSVIFPSKISSIMNSTAIQNSLQECDETISNDVYAPAFILGIFYTSTFIFITCFLNCMSRCFISGLFLFTSFCCGLSLFWVTQPMVTLITFTSFLSMSGPIVSVVTGSAVLLFPTNYRAMALCIILTMGRVGSVVGSNFIGRFFENNCEMTIGVLAGMVFGAGLLNILLSFSSV
ncbi:synaptic vesicle glycoprotein 2B-like [Culicoides brevitarsis]|uniref:synaptic vesicle glycoprotein 2B-like n=1 Tax=Culicoides brevitarsis TaxID=469753 RepID=UPI00307B747B